MCKRRLENKLIFYIKKGVGLARKGQSNETERDRDSGDVSKFLTLDRRTDDVILNAPPFELSFFLVGPNTVIWA